MNENKLLLFAGTTEGRELAEYLDDCGVSCIVCVATEYGEELIEEHTSRHSIRAGRLDEAQMEALIRTERITHVVDSTHPYAAAVTENIRQAAQQAGCTYLRLLRAPAAEELSWDKTSGKVVWVDSVDEAAAFLKDQEGIILAATGSKELAKYTAIPDYRNRVVARILSTPESMEIAAGLGFSGKNLICMQGPFSEQLNIAMLRQCGASWMVTKESGKAGGFPEKVRAAETAGAGLVVVGRPLQEAGYSPEELRTYLQKTFDLTPREETVKKAGRSIALIGIGMGNAGGMTREAWEACEKADVLIGARRMVEETADTLCKPFYTAYIPGEIRDFVDRHPQYRRFAILLSGDVGFYSGAKKLEEIFDGEELQVFCGISSVVYLCGALHTSWEDVRLISLHGRSQNLVAAVRQNRKVFALVGKQESFHAMCRELLQYGLQGVRVHAGCDLSYPAQRIISGMPEELLEAQTGDLTAVLIENPTACETVTHGLPDEAFTRAKVPMTKEEVRTISLSKLRLQRDSVIVDVGAGTGSVSIEMALRAVDGKVYAVEKKPEAVALIRENALKLGASNLEIIEGFAPEALEALPAATHAFIGGSSGNMRQILTVLLGKNPRCRIVVNAIALETLQETMDCIRELPVEDVDIASVSIGKAKEIGRYHMMMGQNPVYVISFSGKEESEKPEVTV